MFFSRAIMTTMIVIVEMALEAFLSLPAGLEKAHYPLQLAYGTRSIMEPQPTHNRLSRSARRE